MPKGTDLQENQQSVDCTPISVRLRRVTVMSQSPAALPTLLKGLRLMPSRKAEGGSKGFSRNRFQ